VTCVAVSSDGRRILSGSEDRSLRLWDIASGTEIRRWGAAELGVKSVAWAPNGPYAVSGGGWGSPARLWDTATGTEIRRFQSGQASDVLAVAFSPEGRLIATGGADHTVRCWDTATGQELRRLEGHAADVVSVGFSPDRKLVVSGEADLDRDGTVRLWDLQSGREFRRFGEKLCFVNAVAFSAAGDLVLATTMDAKLYAWEASTGRDAYSVDVGKGNLLCLAVSARGRWLLTGSGTDYHPPESIAESGADNTVRLLDAADGRELRRFDGHTGNVNAVAFTPAGDQAVSASADHTVMVWPLTP
jgi:WD40 repeat protein